MAKEIMFDIETLGTRAGYIVLEAAMIAYDVDGEHEPKTHEVAKIRLPIADQLKAGLEIDPGTMQWWLDPSRKDYLSELIRDGRARDINYQLATLTAFFHRNCESETTIWQYGTIDIPMIEEVLHRFGYDTSNGLPWRYQQVANLRTLVSSMERYFPGAKDAYYQDGKKTAHSALDDATAQTYGHFYLHRFLTNQNQ